MTRKIPWDVLSSKCQINPDLRAPPGKATENPTGHIHVCWHAILGILVIVSSE